MRYLIILLILFSCQKEPAGTEVYIIEKNKHYSNGNKNIGQPESFDIWIDYMWWYDDITEDAHWNKLIGWSEDTHHHKNSIRVAWRSTDKKIRFALYAYVDAKRIIKEFPTRYDLEQTVNIRMYKQEDEYHIWVNGEHLFCEAGNKKYIYTLFPYFGGNDTAPHRMRFIFNF